MEDRPDRTIGSRLHHGTAEENYPLLLMLGEDDYKSSFANKRSHGIHSGATTILSQWPDALNACWLTSLFLLLISLLTLLIVLSSLGTPYLLYCQTNPGHTSPTTIVHLVKGTEEWTSAQRTLVQRVARACQMRGCSVHVTAVRDMQWLRRAGYVDLEGKKGGDGGKWLWQGKIMTHWRKRMHQLIQRSLEQSNQTKNQVENSSNVVKVNLTTDSTSTEIKKLPCNIDDFLDQYPNLTKQEVTFEEYFSLTPLAHSWKNLNDNVKIFAIRVLELWQQGGVSFSLETTEYSPVNGVTDASVDVEIGGRLDFLKNERRRDKYFFSAPNSTINETTAISKSIDTNKNQFQIVESTLDLLKNTRDGVAIADLLGVHLATKTPCHAFFGELLACLRRATKDDQIEGIVKRTLVLLCRVRQVNRKVCDLVMV